MFNRSVIIYTILIVNVVFVGAYYQECTYDLTPTELQGYDDTIRRHFGNGFGPNDVIFAKKSADGETVCIKARVENGNSVQECSLTFSTYSNAESYGCAYSSSSGNMQSTFSSSAFSYFW